MQRHRGLSSARQPGDGLLVIVEFMGEEPLALGRLVSRRYLRMRRKEKREPLHAGGVVTWDDVFHAPLVNVVAHPRAEGADIYQDPGGFLLFNVLREERQLRFEFVVGHSRGRFFPVDADDSFRLVPVDPEKPVFVYLSRSHWPLLSALPRVRGGAGKF